MVRIAAFFNVPPESLYKELPGRTEELDLGSQLHRQMTALRPDHRRKVLAKLVKDFG